MVTPYKLLTDEQQQIIRDRNLKYYHNNKEKIKERTQIYWQKYYEKNHIKMLERQKKYYRKQRYFYGIDIENVINKSKEIDKITVYFN
jgi:hypothetical protein